MRQLLTESLALAVVATALGTLLAAEAVGTFRRINPIELPAGVTVDMNLAVLTFTAILAMATTIVFGLLPAWRASHIDVQTALKSGGRGIGSDQIRSRVTKGLIVAEISLSLVLLVGAGLLVESVLRFASAPLGFEPRGLMTVSLNLPAQRYAIGPQRVAFFDRLMNRLGAVPDVQRFALSTVLPLRSGRGSHVLVVEGRPAPSPGNAIHDIGTQSVTPDYFAVMNVGHLEGRAFGSGDREGTAAVAIVNDALAKKYFSDENPIGRRIRFFNEPEAANPWVTVVGVVANERRTTPYEEMTWADAPVVYRPLAQQAPLNDVALLVRPRTGGKGIAATIEQQIAQLDPGVVVGGVETAQHLIDRYVAHPRFRAVLLGSFAGIALMLAVVGLYAVLSQLVVHRTHEIGVRMALGAQRRDVLALIVKEGMLLAVLGTAGGLVAASWLTRFLSSLLFGVRAGDPVTLSAVSVLLLAATFLATYLPAKRAASIDPLIALRCE